jgi:crotonobetainyl-CoA:carnitine CoA-transferase CaiB-like acyl-CoA transferase
MRSQSCEEILAKLEATGTPAAKVRNPREAVADPLVVERGDTVALGHPRYGIVQEVYGIGMPIRFSDASGDALSCAPSGARGLRGACSGGSATASPPANIRSASGAKKGTRQ